MKLPYGYVLAGEDSPYMKEMPVLPITYLFAFHGGCFDGIPKGVGSACKGDLMICSEKSNAKMAV